MRDDLTKILLETNILLETKQEEESSCSCTEESSCSCTFCGRKHPILYTKSLLLTKREFDICDLTQDAKLLRTSGLNCNTERNFCCHNATSMCAEQGIQLPEHKSGVSSHISCFTTALEFLGLFFQSESIEDDLWVQDIPNKKFHNIAAQPQQQRLTSSSTLNNQSTCDLDHDITENDRNIETNLLLSLTESTDKQALSVSSISCPSFSDDSALSLTSYYDAKQEERIDLVDEQDSLLSYDDAEDSLHPYIESFCTISLTSKGKNQNQERSSDINGEDVNKINFMLSGLSDDESDLSMNSLDYFSMIQNHSTLCCS